MVFELQSRKYREIEIRKKGTKRENKGKTEKSRRETKESNKKKTFQIISLFQLNY